MLLGDAIREVLGTPTSPVLVPWPPAAPISAVYFLFLGSEVVYVGQSTDVLVRVTTHYMERLKVFDGASYLPCRDCDLGRIESALIQKLKPKYNKSRNGAPTHLLAEVLDLACDFAVGFLQHTDEDGIAAYDLFRRVWDRFPRGSSFNAKDFFRRLDADPRVTWHPSEGLFRFRRS